MIKLVVRSLPHYNKKSWCWNGVSSARCSERSWYTCDRRLRRDWERDYSAATTTAARSNVVQPWWRELQSALLSFDPVTIFNVFSFTFYCESVSKLIVFVRFIRRQVGRFLKTEKCAYVKHFINYFIVRCDSICKYKIRQLKNTSVKCFNLFNCNKRYILHCLIIYFF